MQILEDGSKELSQVRVEIEEMDERIADAKKDMYDFRRDIIEEGQDPRTGRTVAEKMVKYLEDRVRNKDTTIEKLRLKNASLKVRLSIPMAALSTVPPGNAHLPMLDRQGNKG